MKKRDYTISLKERIAMLVEKHGNQRAAALVTGIERSYFFRLASGQKDNPSPEVLRRLGLRKEVIYWVKI